ncbi:YhzD-like protein OS=Ureibacillus acetophenoni OX=614649 GN=SAMN05877842_10755 PE=4 SV=1 [Ureibacillus acetophenoni]
MENYRFTAFEKTGETLFDEVWTFENDDVAKVEGQKRIEENGVAEKTHRLVNSSGKLLLFHV